MISENESVRLVFGLKVKTLRQQRHLSYHQLAEKTGLSLSYLHDIETGKKYPKANKILLLAKALEVDYDYLVSLKASKKLQPIIELITSDFLNAIPWEHFGLNPAIMLDLFSNTPDRVTAFISTLLKISRSYQMSKESFYNAALRSYQDLHDNYFPDLEQAVMECREKLGATENLSAWIETILKEKFDITVDRNELSYLEALQSIRSYYSRTKKVLFLNRGQHPAQEKFLKARELAFQYLDLQERPYETIIQKSSSFDVLLNNFKASYFAVALLIPEKELVEDLKSLASEPVWREAAWLKVIKKYDASPEMFMQRLTNLLPRHFGIESIFFLRINGDAQLDNYEMTKEIHLSQMHNPYANELHEHYCRRWVSINILKEAKLLEDSSKMKAPIIRAQISRYWQTNKSYFCVSITKPRTESFDDFVSVTLGLLIDEKLLQRFRFIEDPAIVVRVVNTTCERCSIFDCLERAVPPTSILKEEQSLQVQEALAKLD